MTPIEQILDAVAHSDASPAEIVEAMGHMLGGCEPPTAALFPPLLDRLPLTASDWQRGRIDGAAEAIAVALERLGLMLGENA